MESCAVYLEKTNYYYLQSRYYDPSICRFINADMPEFLGIGESLAKWNLFSYCKNDAINCSDPNGYFAFEIDKRNIKMRFNNWETTLIAWAVGLGLGAIDIIALIIGEVYAFKIVTAILVAAEANINLSNILGGNKGVYIQVGYSILAPVYLSILPNQKEPKGFHNIWEVFEECRKYVKKIVKKIGVKRIKKIASKSKTNQICVLAQILYDAYCGKKVLRKNYYIK